jgi:hypothetical protein
MSFKMNLYEMETPAQALAALLWEHELHNEVAGDATDEELSDDYDNRFLHSGLLDGARTALDVNKLSPVPEVLAEVEIPCTKDIHG